MDIGARVLNGIPHSALGCEMNDPLEPVGLNSPAMPSRSARSSFTKEPFRSPFRRCSGQASA